MLKEKVINSGKGIFYFISNEILTKIDDFKVKELIRKTQSSRLPERTLAKAKLLKFYPEVLEVMEVKRCSGNHIFWGRHFCSTFSYPVSPKRGGG